MKALPCILILALTACSGGRRTTSRQSVPAEPAPVRNYGYTVRSVYPHDTRSYTQGLLYDNGMFWEGTGQYGGSVLQKIDPQTGRTQVLARLPRSEFGEGIALLDGKIYQLTWHANKAYVYDAATGRELRQHRYPGEGWGLTTDGHNLYMSDGSEYIHTIDPETFRRLRSTVVTFQGQPVELLNELEWIEGRIWANVYTSDRIVIIDPASGRVEGVVDLTGLLAEEDLTPQTDVLNGIAYDSLTRRIFVTGKNWNKLFEIALEER